MPAISLYAATEAAEQNFHFTQHCRYSWSRWKQYRILDRTKLQQVLDTRPSSRNAHKREGFLIWVRRSDDGRVRDFIGHASRPCGDLGREPLPYKKRDAGECPSCFAMPCPIDEIIDLQTENRPLIFMSHSLGGIVLKEVGQFSILSLLFF